MAKKTKEEKKRSRLNRLNRWKSEHGDYILELEAKSFENCYQFIKSDIKYRWISGLKPSMKEFSPLPLSKAFLMYCEEIEGLYNMKSKLSSLYDEYLASKRNLESNIHEREDLLSYYENNKGDLIKFSVENTINKIKELASLSSQEREHMVEIGFREEQIDGFIGEFVAKLKNVEYDLNKFIATDTIPFLIDTLLTDTISEDEVINSGYDISTYLRDTKKYAKESTFENVEEMIEEWKYRTVPTFDSGSGMRTQNIREVLEEELFSVVYESCRNNIIFPKNVLANNENDFDYAFSDLDCIEIFDSTNLSGFYYEVLDKISGMEIKDLFFVYNNYKHIALYEEFKDRG
jgi:hypothetical protein